MRRVLRNRQPDLTIVFENIHDPHNVGAIFRSAEAVGVAQTYMLYTRETPPRLHPKSSASAKKWIDRRDYSDPEQLASNLHDRGFQLLATHLGADAISVFDVDWTRPSAILLGNENRGISPDLLAMADGNVQIPMFGMIQSLNVSVAAAVLLFEACRQRLAAGMYPHPEALEEIVEGRIDEWIDR